MTESILCHFKLCINNDHAEIAEMIPLTCRHMTSLFDYLYSIICHEIESFEPNVILSELDIYPLLMKSFKFWKSNITSLLKGNHNDQVDRGDSIATLSNLSQEEIVGLLSTILLLLIVETNEYQSRTGVLLSRLCKMLKIDISTLEFRVIEIMASSSSIMSSSSCSSEEFPQPSPTSPSPSLTDKKQIDESKRKKKQILLTGIGALGGGILSALTAGLTAPLIIPALSALLGGGALLATSSTAAIITSSALFGTAGAGLTAYKFQKRFGDLKDFQFHSLVNPINPVNDNNDGDDHFHHGGLHSIICISGWLRDSDDITLPWSTLGKSPPSDDSIDSSTNHMSSLLSTVTRREEREEEREGGLLPRIRSSNVYLLQFEKNILLDLGKALKKFATSSAATIATTQILQHTILAGLVSSLMFPLAIIQMGDIIDNPWSMGMERAKSAGILLAHILKDRYLGKRPIDLYGYSLGALVIVSCLEELLRIQEEEEEEREREKREGKEEIEEKNNSSFQDIIQNVIIFGVPTMAHHDTLRWHKMKSIVPGRFVHCYSRKDWILKFLYRSTSLQFEDIAGLCALRGCPDIESVDLTAVIEGHLEYGEKMDELLDLLL